MAILKALGRLPLLVRLPLILLFAVIWGVFGLLVTLFRRHRDWKRKHDQEDEEDQDDEEDEGEEEEAEPEVNRRGQRVRYATKPRTTIRGR